MLEIGYSVPSGVNADLLFVSRGHHTFF